MTSELKPCPFCKKHLTIRKSVNPYGRCETEGCWMNETKIAVPLDDAVQVSAFNTRTTPAPCDELKTVEYQYKPGGNEYWTNTTRHKISECKARGWQTRKLVTRQNAEEVIAAKDARIAELEKLLAEAQSVHRWSVDGQGNGVLYVCKGDHDKYETCKWDAFVPIERAVKAEADNKRLREALEAIAGDTTETRFGPWPTEGSKIARAALEEVKP